MTVGDFRTSLCVESKQRILQSKNCVRVRISKKGARDYDKQDEETYRSFVVASGGDDDDVERGEGRGEK